MARGITNVGIPIDEAVILRPGVKMKESDHPGAAKHLHIPLEHPENAAKGDLGSVVMKDFDSRALPAGDGAVPWKNLRGGK